jgi:hypothetical protein
MERISILRGLVVWHTPWKKIEKAIAGLDEEPVRGSRFEAEAVRGSGFGAEAVRGSGFEVPEKAKIQQDGSKFEVAGQVKVKL